VLHTAWELGRGAPGQGPGEGTSELLDLAWEGSWPFIQSLIHSLIGHPSVHHRPCVFCASRSRKARCQPNQVAVLGTLIRPWAGAGLVLT
jgi:hypothetical protein